MIHLAIDSWIKCFLLDVVLTGICWSSLIGEQGAALVNLGNTCFLNAVLQCLTHTVPLVQMIRKTDHSASHHGTRSWPVFEFMGSRFCVLFGFSYLFPTAKKSTRLAGDDAGFCSFCALKAHINGCLFLSRLVVSPTYLAQNLSSILLTRL